MLPATDVPRIVDAARVRAAKEEAFMAELRAGALTLDLYGLRDLGEPEER